MNKDYYELLEARQYHKEILANQKVKLAELFKWQGVLEGNRLIELSNGNMDKVRLLNLDIAYTKDGLSQIKKDINSIEKELTNINNKIETYKKLNGPDNPSR